MFRPLIIALLFAPVAALGQSTPLQITVTGIEGAVQVREGDDKPWRKPTLGEILGPGAEFRTGPRGAVRCHMPPDQTFTIDRLGVIKVLKALQESGKITTDLAMQYGRTRYDIEQAGVEHAATIRSPNGTLALRGTRVSLFDQPPYAPVATSLTGRAVYANAKRQVALGGKGTGKAQVDEGSESAADNAAKVAQVQRVIDPRAALELTEAEARQLAIEVTRGGIRFDRLIVGGFRTPPNDLAAAGLLPGKLNFVATWTGFADIDLFVIVNPNAPNQRILGNPSVTRLFQSQGVSTTTVSDRLPSGARIDFDKVSAQKGDFEVAYWPKANYSAGNYGIGIIHQDFRDKNPGYSAVSDIKLEVYQDGKKLNTVLTNPEEVLAGTARPKFGTTYETKTDLNNGRDVVSTIAVVPAGTPAATPANKGKGKAAAAPAAPKPVKRGR
ncbi:MAG TPA: hypothetical protein VK986_14550 [Tepidisphaeraceae bacterium]|nr:hypothetical protein [Tepidisphaeraceae bacterium]